VRRYPYNPRYRACWRRTFAAPRIIPGAVAMNKSIERAVLFADIADNTACLSG
jgi:hypothetical protein